MKTLAVVVLLYTSAAAAAPTIGDFGKVDMKSLGGRSTGASQLQEMVSGGAGTKDATPVLRGTLAGIRDCHEAAIGRGATRGNSMITVTLELKADGQVNKVTPETSGVVDDVLKTCLVGLFKPLRFQVTTGTAEVRYGIAMSAADTGPPASDADKMCHAAEAMLAQGWTHDRPQVLATLATRLSEAHPSDAAQKVLDSLARTPMAQIPARWTAGLKAKKLPSPRCEALEKLLDAR